MAQERNVKRYVFTVCVIAALGGLLFGLDQGFVNGSLKFIEKSFGWTTLQGETFASILVIGCIVGTLISGWVARAIGRKRTLLLAALFFTCFTLWGSLTSSEFILFATRFCIGLAVGCASFCVPLYLSEVAPTKFRGGFIAMYQLMITIGIFLIYISNFIIGEYFESWRLMLGVISIPAFIMLIGVFAIPKTPRWLMLKGRENDARSVMENTRETKEEADKEMMEIKESLAEGSKKKASFWEIISTGYFVKVLILGVCLQLLQQLSGINSVIYYSTKIFTDVGFDNPALATIIIGAVNMLATIVAVKYVDKWGRKPILYGGLCVMAITCIIIGVVFHIKETLPQSAHLSAFDEVLVLVSTITYIIAFAISLGPIMWVLCAEIFPLEVRDLGVTLTTVTNWIGVFLVAQFSMSLMNSVGGSGLFFIFAIVCIIGFFFIGIFAPETKGTTLEEIEMNLKSGKKLRKLGERQSL